MGSLHGTLSILSLSARVGRLAPRVPGSGVSFSSGEKSIPDADDGTSHRWLRGGRRVLSFIYEQEFHIANALHLPA